MTEPRPRHVPKFFNCYIPYQVFGLAELRAGASHIAFLAVLASYFAVGRPRLSVSTACITGAYITGMFFIQRRIASGLPLRYRSLRHFRLSRDNFRRTSTFLKDMFTRRAEDPRVLTDAVQSHAVTVGRTAPVAVLTGGERGIGFEVLRQLVHQGFDVVMCCPFEKAATEAIARASHGAKHARIEYVHLDLSDEKSVRACAQAILSLTTHVDLLINNAGILSTKGLERRTNASGVELVLAVNFLGPALLTELLLDVIVQSAPSRIVNVSSLMHLDACVPAGHTPLTVMMENCAPHPCTQAQNYSLSKLLIVCYTRDLARRLGDTGVSVVSLHPGVVLTDIYNHWGIGATLMKAIMRTVFKFPAEGAEVVLRCAFSDNIRSGGFYADCDLADDVVSPLAQDDSHNTRVTMFVQDHFKLDTTDSVRRMARKN